MAEESTATHPISRLLDERPELIDMPAVGITRHALEVAAA